MNVIFNRGFSSAPGVHVVTSNTSLDGEKGLSLMNVCWLKFIIKRAKILLYPY
jgi:hypothetical protein